MCDYSKKFKILFMVAAILLCFSSTLISFSWESNLTHSIPQPSRSTQREGDIRSYGIEDVPSQEHHHGDHQGQTPDGSSVEKTNKMVRNFLDDGFSSIKKLPFDRRRHHEQTTTPMDGAVVNHKESIPALSTRVWWRGESNEEIASSNLSLSFQASQRRFERKMALYGQQEIEGPVLYTRENIPSDLQALAPDLFRRFPREFLPEYKSPCWKTSTKDTPTSSSNSNDTLHCLPYFFIGGFPKCGTTDLWSKLMSHPSMVKTNKEPQWWTKTKFEDAKLEKHIDRYSKLTREMELQGRKDLISCDGSALTFQDSKAVIDRLPPNLRGDIKFVTADFIRAALPDLKIIGIVRNPTERLYSAFLYFNKERKTPQDFHVVALKTIENFYTCTDDNDLTYCAHHLINAGCYSFYIREFMARFPREQLYFLRTEDWSNDPAYYMKEIYTFLDIDPLSEEHRQKVTMTGKLNRRKPMDRRVGRMLPETKELLDDFYRPCNKDLAKLLKDDRYLWRTN